MDLVRKSDFSSGYVAPVMPEIPPVGLDQWSSPGDQAVRAAEDEYKVWNASETHLNSNYDSKPSLLGSEPATKKAKNFQTSDSVGAANNRSKAIGKMFFKTKLCCNFRAGVCPYITNCNFAHGIEELRRPPPNWQEIVAAYEERGGVVVEPPREEHQIPTFSSSDLKGESQRPYKSRHCKKFFTDEGCPYGDGCTFLHDEQSRARESFAISLSPSVVGGYGNGVQKPSNWKTRICNKWETTGTCPFGNKCHFAHGYQELHKYGGVPMDAENKETTLAVPDTKQLAMQSRTAGNAVAMAPSSSNVYRSGIGVPPHMPAGAVQAQAVAHGAYQKWRGPDKISKIYGDWIDDIE